VGLEGPYPARLDYDRAGIILHGWINKLGYYPAEKRLRSSDIAGRKNLKRVNKEKFSVNPAASLRSVRLSAKRAFAIGTPEGVSSLQRPESRQALRIHNDRKAASLTDS